MRQTKEKYKRYDHRGIVLAVAAFAFMFAMTQSGDNVLWIWEGFAVVVLVGAAISSFGKGIWSEFKSTLKEVLVPGWHGGQH